MSNRDHAHVSAVILAAGSASRAGVTKQLLPLDGKPLLQHVIDNVVSSSVDAVVLVLGHDGDRVESAIEAANIIVVRNDEYEAGQASSLISGVDAVSEKSAAVVVVLGDQPGIDGDVIDAVVSAWRAGDALFAVAAWRGTRGNPVIIDRALFDDVRSLKGDTGARALFQLHPQKIAMVEFDRPMPPDVDTLDDYRAITEPQSR